MSRVLVIEGDGAFRATLAASLTQAGHEVEAAASGQAGLAIARASRPNVVTIDLALPDSPGVELCRTMRSDPLAGRASLLVLGTAGDEDERVAAFEAGADDYVQRPPSLRELLLRVRALARRRTSAPPAPDTVTVGPLTIDRASRRAEMAGRSLELTRREFDVLVILADRIGRVQTRDTLMAEVWGEEPGPGAERGDRVVDTTIKRLRKKLNGAGPAIRTVRGVGYKLVDA